MSTSTTEMHLLGAFQVQVDEATVPIAPSAARVLVLLAMNQRGMSRTRLAGTMWPEVPDPRAFANLRATLWRLPEPVQAMVLSSSSMLALTDEVQVDCHTANRVARDVLDRDAIVAVGSGELALLCRPLLPEWDEDWLVFERERVRQLHIHALERLGQRYLERGDPLSAVDVGIAAVGCEPLRESAHVLVIRAHLAAGNRFEARSCFQHYRRLLWRELRLGPSPEMVRLGSAGSMTPT